MHDPHPAKHLHPHPHWHLGRDSDYQRGCFVVGGEVSDHRHYILAHDTARKLAAAQCMTAPEGWHVRIMPPTRSLDQNGMLWPLLTDVSRQVDWYGQKLTPDEWKDVFTAALKREKVVPGINGGFVVLGMRTSQMNKKDFSDLLEIILAFGAEKGVKWTNEAMAA